MASVAEWYEDHGILSVVSDDGKRYSVNALIEFYESEVQGNREGTPTYMRIRSLEEDLVKREHKLKRTQLALNDIKRQMKKLEKKHG